MRKFLATAAIACTLMSTTAHAEASREDRICLMMEQMARIAMQVRQQGVPMGEAMKLPEQLAGDEPDVVRMRDLFRDMVVIAYEAPRWNTDQNQKNAVLDFANSAAVECYSH